MLNLIDGIVISSNLQLTTRILIRLVIFRIRDHKLYLESAAMHFTSMNYLFDCRRCGLLWDSIDCPLDCWRVRVRMCIIWIYMCSYACSIYFIELNYWRFTYAFYYHYHYYVINRDLEYEVLILIYKNN